MTKKEIAAAWGTSAQYVSKLAGKCARSGSPMPEFRTAAEAVAWRSTRKLRRTAGAGAVAIDGWCDSSVDMTPLEEEKAARVGKDFDELMLADAEEVVLLAKQRYRVAVNAGNDNQAAAWLKNWNEAARSVAAQRERFLDLQAKAGRLIQIDVALDVVMAILRDVRSALDNFGERCATRANPGAPEVALGAINEEMDRVMVRIAEGREKVAGDFLHRQQAVDRKTRDFGDGE